MKYILLFVCQLTVSFAAVCQVPQWSDFKLLAGQSHDEGNAITVDKHDNTYLAVSSQNPLSSLFHEPLPDEVCNVIQPVRGNSYNGAVFRFDSSRNLTLSVVIEGATLGQIGVDGAGNIYVSGLMQYGAQRDAFVKKYSSTGDLIWSKLVESASSGRNADDFITSLDVSSDGSLVLCGLGYGDQVALLGQYHPGPLSFVAKLNPDGEVAWTQSFGSDLGYGAFRVKFDGASDVLMAGNEKVAGTNELRATFAKLEAMTGDVLWKKQFHSNGQYVPRGTAISTTSNLYVFGGTFGGELTIDGITVRARGALDVFLLQCDLDGNINWVKTAGSSGRETLYDLAEDNGKIYLTGGFADGFQLNSTSYASKGNTDVYIGALDNDGNTLWVLTGGSADQKDDIIRDEKGSKMAINSKGHLQVIGTTIGRGNFGSLNYVASEETLTNAFWLTLGDKASTYTVYYPCDGTTVLDFSLTVYPNPFEQSLTISNSQGLNLDYNLVLTNSVGQKLDERYFPDSSTITVDAWNALAAGVYFLKIDAGDYSKVFKLIKK
ncbi:T9SS type A sorting domain-containing protein [Pontibacter virosus]|uniref:Putative secreted protein (Por secretion system target) n=1 Tax=Pontibacter virosus TaxID=1765052 RepID=A0A2U1APP7_9BACT|nr:T9SS type A sorting domain-containing protein [Pontibacter virosus]PVY38403.1 putative secreted protein (Por secretion system target) [Pontibacter virosus]